jgi:hypothetical protein
MFLPCSSATMQLAAAAGALHFGAEGHRLICTAARLRFASDQKSNHGRQAVFLRLGEVQEMLQLWSCAAVCAKGPVVDQHILIQEVPRAGWHFDPSMPVTASSHRLLMDKPIN